MVDGLWRLEEAEHCRLVEKWIYDDLSDEELAMLPAELRARVQTYFRKLVEEGLRSAEEGGYLDGPVALQKVRERLAARRETEGP